MMLRGTSQRTEVRTRIRITTDDSAAMARKTATPWRPPLLRWRLEMQRNDGVLDELDEVFDRCNVNGDRCIGFEEFRGLLLEIADSRSDSELRVCFEEIDRNHDGRISRQELRAWWPIRQPART
jgi:hypothetical protein